MQCVCRVPYGSVSLYKNREKFTANHNRLIVRIDNELENDETSMGTMQLLLFFVFFSRQCAHLFRDNERGNAFTRIKAIYSPGLCQKAVRQYRKIIIQIFDFCRF